MTRHLATAVALGLALAGPALAQDGPKLTPGTHGLYADGTWDCSDANGTYLGAVVIADLSYAFIDPDGTVGTYGKLNRDDWMGAPAFFILSGELKDKFGGIGLSLNGPSDRPEDFSDWNKLRLKVVVTAETMFYCARRKGPAT